MEPYIVQKNKTKYQNCDMEPNILQKIRNNSCNMELVILQKSRNNICDKVTGTFYRKIERIKYM